MATEHISWNFTLASRLAFLIAWLATQNYDWLFAVGAACSLAGLVVIRWFVREPRWAQPAAIEAVQPVDFA